MLCYDFFERKYNSMNIRNKELSLHWLMCLNGGFLGGYTIFCRNDNFGLAQTANMIQICKSVCVSSTNSLILRILGLLIFFSGIALGTILKRSMNISLYAILVNFAGALILLLIPVNADPLIGIMPVFFMASTQWSAFHGTKEYNCSTIFSTNNLKQFIDSGVEYILSRQNAQREKCLFFGVTLALYHLGVIIALLSCRRLATYASFLCIPVMIIALSLNTKKLEE